MDIPCGSALSDGNISIPSDRREFRDFSLLGGDTVQLLRAKLLGITGALLGIESHTTRSEQSDFRLLQFYQSDKSDNPVLPFFHLLPI